MKTFTYFLLLLLSKIFGLDDEGLGAISYFKERREEMRQRKALKFSNKRKQFKKK